MHHTHQYNHHKQRILKRPMGPQDCWGKKITDGMMVQLQPSRPRRTKMQRGYALPLPRKKTRLSKLGFGERPKFGRKVSQHGSKTIVNLIPSSVFKLTRRYSLGFDWLYRLSGTCSCLLESRGTTPCCSKTLVSGLLESLPLLSSSTSWGPSGILPPSLYFNQPNFMCFWKNICSLQR